jgi:PAS domain S-box-containing protein
MPTETAWRKREAFLNRVGELAHVGGWEYDTATGAIAWTPETYRIHGLPQDFQPTLETAIAAYAPEARPTIRAAVAQALAGGGGWDLELPFLRADGQRIWVRAVGSATFVDDRPVRLSGTLQDVSAHVAERLSLRQANDRTMLAIDSAAIGIWEWDIRSGDLIWDPWMYRLYDVSPTDETGIYDLWRSHLHPDDRAAAEREIWEAVEGAAPFDTGFRIVRHDGSIRHIRATGRVTQDADGRAMRMIGANWDVTEQARLASELAQKHELLRITLLSIGDAVVTTDACGAVVWLNPVAERLTGWSSAEAHGRELTEIFTIRHAHTGEPVANPVLESLARGANVALASHTMLISRKGEAYWIEDSAAPIRDEQGTILGAVLVFYDVTARRRLECERERRGPIRPKHVFWPT